MPAALTTPGSADLGAEERINSAAVMSTALRRGDEKSCTAFS
jgi:hypothetical protein